MPTGNRPVLVTYDRTANIIKVTLPLARREFPAIWRFTAELNVLDVEVIREPELNLVGFVLTLNARRPMRCRAQLLRIFPVDVIAKILSGQQEKRTIRISAQVLCQATGPLRQIAKFSHTRLRSPELRPTVPLVPGILSQDVIRRRRTEKVLSNLADSSTGRIPAHRFPQPRLKLATTS